MAEGWYQYNNDTLKGVKQEQQSNEFSDFAKDIQPFSFGQKSVNLKTTDSGDILSIKNFAAEMIDLLDLSKCHFKIPTEDGAIERLKKDEAIKKIIDGCLWAVAFLEMKK